MNMQRKSNKLVWINILLVLLLLGTIGFIAFDKLSKKEEGKNFFEKERKSVKYISKEISYDEVGFFDIYIKEGVLEIRCSSDNCINEFKSIGEMYLFEPAKVNNNIHKIDGKYVAVGEYLVGNGIGDTYGIIVVNSEGAVFNIRYRDLAETGKIKLVPMDKYKDVVSIDNGVFFDDSGYGGGYTTVLTDVEGNEFELTE